MPRPAAQQGMPHTCPRTLPPPPSPPGAITLEEHSGGKLCLAVEEERLEGEKAAVQLPSFAFKQFAVLGQLAKCGAQRCLLQLGGADAPLSLVAELSGGATAQLFLAPVVEDMSK